MKKDLHLAVALLEPRGFQHFAVLCSWSACFPEVLVLLARLMLIVCALLLDTQCGHLPIAYPVENPFALPVAKKMKYRMQVCFEHLGIVKVLRVPNMVCWRSRGPRACHSWLQIVNTGFLSRCSKRMADPLTELQLNFGAG